MEMIIMSGAGTLVLLVAMLLDYVLAADLRRRAGVDGISRTSGPGLPVARPTADDIFTFDQAA